MENGRMSRDEVQALKKAAAQAMQMVVGWMAKHPFEKIAASARGKKVLDELKENNVAYAFSHMAAARGQVDPEVVYAVFGSQPGAQMAVQHLLKVREETGKEIAWFNSRQINALLASLTEADLAKLAKPRREIKSLMDLAEDEHEESPVDFLRSFAKPRERKPRTASSSAKPGDELDDDLDPSGEELGGETVDGLDDEAGDELGDPLLATPAPAKPKGTTVKGSGKKTDVDPKADLVNKLKAVTGKSQKTALQVAKFVEDGKWTVEQAKGKVKDLKLLA